jgi:hypothetical protein
VDVAQPAEVARRAEESKGHDISHPVVRDCLHKLHYSLQANRKVREGSEHMDRNAQFEYISKRAGSFLTDGQPVISVDTKYARTGIMHGLESGAWPEPAASPIFGHECVGWCSLRELFLSIIVALLGGSLSCSP